MPGALVVEPFEFLFENPVLFLDGCFQFFILQQSDVLRLLEDLGILLGQRHLAVAVWCQHIQVLCLLVVGILRLHVLHLVESDILGRMVVAIRSAFVDDQGLPHKGVVLVVLCLACRA